MRNVRQPDGEKNKSVMKMKKKRIHLPYAEARARVLESGTDITKLSCPFCTWIHTIPKRRIESFYPPFQPLHPIVLKFRAGRGGIFRLHDVAYTIEQIKQKPEWQPLLEEIAMRAQIILDLVEKENKD